MKCTKTYRIVMLPYDNEQQGFVAENFDVRIKGSAALLDYKGDKVKDANGVEQNKPITYVPYNEKLVVNTDGNTEVDGEKSTRLWFTTCLLPECSSARTM